MDAVAMIRHCGFHQRVISRESICPRCGYPAQFLMDASRDYIGYWTCANRCEFGVPIWRDVTANDCPHPEFHQLHQPATL